MNNLDIYNRLRVVPKEAQKEFNNGRFKGTDINAMWRIKMLTETFGMVGFGWKIQIVEKWTEMGANNEIKAFVRIHLFVKVDGEWSDAIEGIGGSHFVSANKNGMANNDECYKMAYTDAIGVACKALGMGADIYWSTDQSKYQSESEVKAQESANKVSQAVAALMDVKSRKELINVMTKIAEDNELKTNEHVLAARNMMNSKYPKA